HFDRRRAPLGVATRRRSPNRQNRPTQRDLVGPAGRQRRGLGAIEVLIQAPVQVSRDERRPDPPAFTEDRNPALVSIKPDKRSPAEAFGRLDRAQARLLLELEGERIGPGLAGPGLGFSVQGPETLKNSLSDLGGDVGP